MTNFEDSPLNWRNVFYAYNMKGKPDIYKVNKFLWEFTAYLFFAFNGRIYKVGNPYGFNMVSSDTGVCAKDLDQ